MWRDGLGSLWSWHGCMQSHPILCLSQLQPQATRVIVFFPGPLLRLSVPLTILHGHGLLLQINCANVTKEAEPLVVTFSVSPDIMSISAKLEENERPPEARLKEWRPCTHPDPYQQLYPWIIVIKVLTKSPQVGTHSVEGMSPLCPPLLGKAIKLYFLLHPKICLWDLIRHQCTEAKFWASKWDGVNILLLPLFSF